MPLPKYQWMDYGNGLTLVDGNGKVVLMASTNGIATRDSATCKNRLLQIDDEVATLIVKAVNRDHVFDELVEALRDIAGYGRGNERQRALTVLEKVK